MTEEENQNEVYEDDEDVYDQQQQQYAQSENEIETSAAINDATQQSIDDQICGELGTVGYNLLGYSCAKQIARRGCNDSRRTCQNLGQSLAACPLQTFGQRS